MVATCGYRPLSPEELAVPGEFLFDDVEPSPDALADHAALEFAEGACDLE